MSILTFYTIALAVTAVSSLSVANTVDNTTCSSSYSEFRCVDGGCVRAGSVCDGAPDCADGSDEAACDADSNPLGEEHDEHSVLERPKRQLRGCNKNQFTCRDGSCISFDGKCDGIRDCPDGSDETFPLCRKNQCLPHWFRCAYGACVDGTAPCNNVTECMDNSDELLPSCRNEPMIKGSFTCADGSKIPAYQHCDGVANCADGSDETLRACAGKSCASYLFQCAYGACVDAGADCNGKVECADGSDESYELCNRLGPLATPATPTPTLPPPETTGACVLPPYPDHGSYIVSGRPNARPGQAFDTVVYNVTCHPGYYINGKETSRVCFNGIWVGDVGECVRFCRLRKDESVTYNCVLTDGSIGFRPCGLLEPDGTLVDPRCNTPNYYYNGVFGYMRCIDGSWDYVAQCTPGLINVTFDSTSFVFNSTNVLTNDSSNNNTNTLILIVKVNVQVSSVSTYWKMICIVLCFVIVVLVFVIMMHKLRWCNRLVKDDQIPIVGDVQGISYDNFFNEINLAKEMRVNKC